MKNLEQQVSIFCAETVKTYAAASLKHVFMFQQNVWLLLGVF